MKFLLSGFLLFLLVSCAPKFLGSGSWDLSQRAVGTASRNRSHLFPNGIYSHRITIVDSKGKKREFRGFLSLGDHDIYVVGLSKLNTTFFKLHENLVLKDISYRFYYPVPKKFKKMFVGLYSSMKKIFLMPSNGFPSHYVDPQQAIEVTMNRYDKNGIPLALFAKYKNFSVWIDLDGYRLMPL